MNISIWTGFNSELEKSAVFGAALTGLFAASEIKSAAQKAKEATQGTDLMRPKQLRHWSTYQFGHKKYKPLTKI